jgi:hypothetical protein
MLPSSVSIDQLGYSKTLVKNALFTPIQQLYSQLPTNITNVATQSVRPSVIRSGSFTGNLNVVSGYLKSDNFYSGVNGWRFTAVGDLEANSAVIRGSMYADAGLIGGWVIDDDGLYYNGSGTPNIRTSEAVESGDDGVIIDKDGVRGYSALLGNVFNLPSDGSAPTFSSGTINETTFEISTNAVLRTSETVGDGTVDSNGVLINNTGVFACESYQNLADANVRISYDGSAYFKGTVNASNILSSNIYGTNIWGSIITGANIRTSDSGQRTEINTAGIQLYNGTEGAYYGDMSTTDYQYGSALRTYGTGVLGYINNAVKQIPIYIQAEQSVADIHLPDRTDYPTGTAEVGDLCVVDATLMICTTAGTPGEWTAVGSQTGSHSSSVSPSVSPS